MKEIHPETLKRLRSRYPLGTRVVLIRITTLIPNFNPARKALLSGLMIQEQFM